MFLFLYFRCPRPYVNKFMQYALGYSTLYIGKRWFWMCVNYFLILSNPKFWELSRTASQERLQQILKIYVWCISKENVTVFFF